MYRLRGTFRRTDGGQPLVFDGETTCRWYITARFGVWMHQLFANYDSPYMEIVRESDKKVVFPN